MRFGSFRYLLKQGIKNVWHNRLMSFASIGVLTACLLLIGAAMLFSVNVSKVVGYVSTQNEVVVFVNTDATQEQIVAVESSINAMDNVAGTTYISREQALEDMKSEMGSYSGLFDGLEAENENPLPPSFRVKLKDLSQLTQTTNQISLIEGVYDIRAAEDVASTLTSVNRIVSMAGALIVGLLVIVSLVIISNTIRLTVFGRRKEINIMKFVGATDGFIRLPFVIEGITLGVLSSALSFGIIWLSYSKVAEWLIEDSTTWLATAFSSFVPFSEIGLPLFLGFLIAGGLTGIIGSWISIRKHLKV